jgi:hypothetical protein
LVTCVGTSLVTSCETGDRAIFLLSRVLQPSAACFLHDNHFTCVNARCVLPCCSLHGPICSCAHPVALITCDLGVMLEITGGVSATALAFIFPAACYLMLTPAPWHNPSKMPAIVCVTFGVVVMTMSLFLTLGKVWTREGDAKICMS